MSNPKWLPDAHFGSADAPLPDPELIDVADGEEQEEELDQTPQDVIDMLGFDPKDEVDAAP